MDWFYFTHEAPDCPHPIKSEEDYRRAFPEVIEAVEHAFNHACSTAEKADYRFSRIERSMNPEANHRVVFEPKEQTRPDGIRLMSVAFDAVPRHEHEIIEEKPSGSCIVQVRDWWELDPPFPSKCGGRWGG